VIARFFTFGSVQASSSGLATALGFLAGQASQSGGRGTAGVNPGQWSMAAENRTMAGRGEGTSTLPGAAGGGGPGGGAGGGNAAASGGGSGAAALAGIGFALQKAHQAGTALSGRMEQTAAHGGMQGAYPYSTVSAGQHRAPGGGYGNGSGGQFPAAETAAQGPDAQPARGAADADERLAGSPGGEPDAPPAWSGYGEGGE
jgi:hypothetical protein